MSTNAIAAADPLYMSLAMDLARSAADYGEVPIGAVIVDSQGQIISSGFNLREACQSALGHAELIAIRKANIVTGSWRLSQCSLYVTLEPCLMCAGAIIQARLGRVVFASLDPKAGAFGSLYQLHRDSRLNHRPQVSHGLYSQQYSQLVRQFFASLRQNNANKS